jgi:hypothetical protein
MKCYECGKKIPEGARCWMVFLAGGEIGKPTPATWEVPIGFCCEDRVRDGDLRDGAEVYKQRVVVNKHRPSRPVPEDWKEQALKRRGETRAKS